MNEYWWYTDRLTSIGHGAYRYSMLNNGRHFAYNVDSNQLDLDMDKDGRIYALAADDDMPTYTIGQEPYLVTCDGRVIARSHCSEHLSGLYASVEEFYRQYCKPPDGSKNPDGSMAWVAEYYGEPVIYLEPLLGTVQTDGSFAVLTYVNGTTLCAYEKTAPEVVTYSAWDRVHELILVTNNGMKVLGGWNNTGVRTENGPVEGPAPGTEGGMTWAVEDYSVAFPLGNGFSMTFGDFEPLMSRESQLYNNGDTWSIRIFNPQNTCIYTGEEPAFTGYRLEQADRGGYLAMGIQDHQLSALRGGQMSVLLDRIDNVRLHSCRDLKLWKQEAK